MKVPKETIRPTNLQDFLSHYGEIQCVAMDKGVVVVEKRHHYVVLRSVSSAGMLLNRALLIQVSAK